MREDWTLPPDWRDEAIRLGLAWQRIDRTAEEFRDYWLGVPGERGVKADWKATWRNRVRSVLERQSIPSQRQAQTGATTADLAAQIRAEMGGDPRFRPEAHPPPSQETTAIETDWERIS